MLVAVACVVVIGVIGAVMWQASRTSRHSPSQSQTSALKGKLTCLPHKDTNGPTTEECAYGLMADDGKYYSLSEAEPRKELIINAPFNTPITVKGTLGPDRDSKYKTAGHIVVEEIN